MNTHDHDVFRALAKAGDAAAPRLPAAAGLPGRVLRSDSLLRGEREIGIEHEGALYRLRLTRQGKLILNK